MEQVHALHAVPAASQTCQPKPSHEVLGVQPCPRPGVHEVPLATTVLPQAAASAMAVAVARRVSRR
jgi:hypothetical protein